MMTVIEFFDRESAIENIISTLLCKPDKVIFIGNSLKAMQRGIEKYKAVVRGRGLNVEFEARSVPKNELGTAVRVIEDIISNNEDCVFDLSGGNDICLVAVGVVYGKFADAVKLHRFNITDGSMTDCDSDGIVCACEPIKLSIEECVLLNGGKIKNSANVSYEWDFSNDFKADIASMWAVCRKNPTSWNAQIKLLDKICSDHSDGSELSISVKSKMFENSEELLNILYALNKSGVIRRFSDNGSVVSFRFKNEQVKRALAKSGQVLELVVTVAALETKDKNGEPVYDEVLTGVSIDWEEENSAVNNEIDVILMRGIIPIFISCKNGAVSSDELYKLETVAKRFGGRFAKKALVATELEKLGSKELYIKSRAESLDIRVIDKADTMGDKEFQRKIRNLYI